MIQAIVMVKGVRAILVDGRWQSENEAISKILNSDADAFPVGEFGYEPNRPQAMAEQAVKLLGGSIIHVMPVESEEGVVY